MQIIHTDKAPAAIGPYSQAIKLGGLLYTSGQIPLKENGQMIGQGIEEQTRQVMKNLEAVLKAGDSSLKEVIKTTIFLKSMNDFAAVNEVYGEFFKDHKPARSTVAVQTLPKDALVEIEAIAQLN